jgi:hypothetical protein
MGAICKFCNKDMLKAKGCECIPVKIKGVLYEPVRYGKSDIDNDDGKHNRCHDCGAKWGEYHHPGCDWERCPVCGGQMLTDECADEDQSFDVTQYEEFLKKIKKTK